MIHTSTTDKNSELSCLNTVLFNKSISACVHTFYLWSRSGCSHRQQICRTLHHGSMESQIHPGVLASTDQLLQQRSVDWGIVEIQLAEEEEHFNK